MLLHRMLDYDRSGVVYEYRRYASIPRAGRGAERVRTACQASLIPYALLDADPGGHEAWLTAAVGRPSNAEPARANRRSRPRFEVSSDYAELGLRRARVARRAPRPLIRIVEVDENPAL